MYKSYDSPSRDYLAEWLEADRQLAIAGCHGFTKKSIEDFPCINEKPLPPIPNKPQDVPRPTY